MQTSAAATMLTDVTFWGLLVPLFYRDKFGFALVCKVVKAQNCVHIISLFCLSNKHQQAPVVHAVIDVS
jgi:hypothetical protein